MSKKLEITFLGTSSAIPTKEKNHTAILLNYEPETILFDCGEGTQRQFKKAEISPLKLTRIFLTHWHADHTLGLPGLLKTLALHNYSGKLKIYGPHKTKEKLQLFEQIFGKFEINLEINELSPGQIIKEKEFIIETSAMSHGIPTLAYSFIIKDKIRLDKNKIKKLKLPSPELFGQLQQGKDIIIGSKKIKAKNYIYEEKGKKITIILDTEINENAIKLAKDSDLLITDSSYIEETLQQAKEYQHLTASQAAAIAKKSKVKKLILTHISQRYQHKEKVVLAEAKKVFKNSIIAKDFDKFVI